MQTRSIETCAWGAFAKYQSRPAAGAWLAYFLYATDFLPTPRADLIEWRDEEIISIASAQPYQIELRAVP
jgi:hypothetical protein